jgi:hypothetical protein
MSPRPRAEANVRDVPVATRITRGQKDLLEAVAARKGITSADALRDGLRLFLAIETYEDPPDPAAED